MNIVIIRSSIIIIITTTTTLKLNHVPDGVVKGRGQATPPLTGLSEAV